MATMDDAKRDRLEAAGWESGDAADFLDLDDRERALLKFRYRMTVEVRRLRKEPGISQASLAKLAGTTQPKVAAIENGSPGVGVELLARVFFAAGGRVEVLGPGVEGWTQVPASAVVGGPR